MAVIIDAYCTLGNERETRLDASQLLGMMDRANIDRAVIAPEDREIAVANTGGNNRILEIARRHPDRLVPVCAVNPWSAETGCNELRRAIDAGARMLVLAPALQGFCLGDELSDELMGAAGRLEIPVYVHTGPHSAAIPSQLVLVASRHPQTNFILGHCGSTDFVADMRAVFECASENLWYDLSLVRPFLAADLADMVSPSRLIFGSMAPRSDPAFELCYLDKYLPVAEYPQIFGGNIAGLLEQTAKGEYRDRRLSHTLEIG